MVRLLKVIEAPGKRIASDVRSIHGCIQCGIYFFLRNFLVAPWISVAMPRLSEGEVSTGAFPEQRTRVGRGVASSVDETGGAIAASHMAPFIAHLPTELIHSIVCKIVSNSFMASVGMA